MSKVESRSAHFGRLGTLLLAGVLLGCGSDVKPTQIPILGPPLPSASGQTLEPVITPQETLTPEQIIHSEVDRRVDEFRTHDKTWEQDLWNGSYEYNPRLSFTLDAIDGPLMAVSRARDTLTLMSQSRNPFFKGAEVTLGEIYSDGRLEIVPGVVENPDDPNPPKTPTITVEGKFSDEGKFIVTLVIWEKFALDESNALLMANSLTHAAILASELEEHRKGLSQTLTPDEQEQELLRFMGEERLRIEARAFGEEAQAMIYQVGLLDGRIYTVPESGSEERASTFITLGGENNDTWSDYIEVILTENPDSGQAS